MQFNVKPWIFLSPFPVHTSAFLSSRHLSPPYFSILAVLFFFFLSLFPPFHFIYLKSFVFCLIVTLSPLIPHAIAADRAGLLWSAGFYPRPDRIRLFVFLLLVNFFPHGKTHASVQILQQNGKADPLQAWSGPEGSRKLMFPDYVTTAQGGGKVVSLTHRPHLPPGNPPGTHFC